MILISIIDKYHKMINLSEYDILPQEKHHVEDRSPDQPQISIFVTGCATPIFDNGSRILRYRRRPPIQRPV